MFTQMKENSSTNLVKTLERAPPPSPASPKISPSRSRNTFNNAPRSPSSFFCYSSSYLDIHSRLVTSQSSCELSSSSHYSRLRVKDLRNDAVLDNGKRIKQSFSNIFDRSHLLSKTLSLSFQPHTPTISLVTFSCLADEIAPKTDEYSQSKMANVQVNVQHKSSKKKSENLTTAKDVQQSPAEAKTSSSITIIASNRSLPPQSPTISLVALSLSIKDCSISQQSVSRDNKKFSQGTSEEGPSSLDEEKPSTKAMKVFETVSTKIGIGNLKSNVESLANTKKSTVLKSAAQKKSECNVKETVPSADSEKKNSGRDNQTVSTNTKKSTILKSAAQKKSECKDKVKETVKSADSEKKGTGRDNQTVSTAPSLSPVQPNINQLSTINSSSTIQFNSITADPDSNLEKYYRYWPHLEAIYKNAGARFRLSDSEKQSGLGLQSGDVMLRPALVHYSLGRKGLQFVQDMPNRKTVPPGEDFAPFPCVSSILVNDRPSPLELTRHIKETWANSVRDSDHSDGDLAVPRVRVESSRSASSSSDRERESVESQEESRPYFRNFKNTGKKRVNFSTTASSDVAHSIIRCVVRERSRTYGQSKINKNPSSRPKSKDKVPDDKGSGTSSNAYLLKAKTSETIEVPENSANRNTFIEPESMKPILSEWGEESNMPSPETSKRKTSKVKTQGVRVVSKPKRRKNSKGTVSVKISNTSITPVPAKESSTCVKTIEFTPNVKETVSPKDTNEPQNNLEVCEEDDEKNVVKNEDKPGPADYSSGSAKQLTHSTGRQLSKQKERRGPRWCVPKRGRRKSAGSRGKAVDRASSPIIGNFLFDANFLPAYPCMENSKLKEMCDTGTTMEIKMVVHRGQQTVPVVNLQYPQYEAVVEDGKPPQGRLQTRRQKPIKLKCISVSDVPNLLRENNKRNITKPVIKRKQRILQNNEASNRLSTYQEEKIRCENCELSDKKSQEIFKTSRCNEIPEMRSKQGKQKPLRNNAETMKASMQVKNKQRMNEGSGKSTVSQENNKTFVAVKSSPKRKKDTRKCSRYTLRMSARRQKQNALKSGPESVKKQQKMPSKGSKSSISPNESFNAKCTRNVALSKQGCLTSGHSMKGNNNTGKRKHLSLEELRSVAETNTLDKKYSHTSTNSIVIEDRRTNDHKGFVSCPIAEPKFYGSEYISSKVMATKPSCYAVNNCHARHSYTNNAWPNKSHEAVGASYRSSPQPQGSYSLLGRSSVSKPVGQSPSADSGVSCGYYVPLKYGSPPASFGGTTTGSNYDATSQLNGPYGPTSHTYPCCSSHSREECMSRQCDCALYNSSYDEYLASNSESSNISDYTVPLYRQSSLEERARHSPSSLHISSSSLAETERLQSPCSHIPMNWPVNSSPLLLHERSLV